MNVMLMNFNQQFDIIKASCLTASAVDRLLNSLTATGIPLYCILKHFQNVPLLSLPILSFGAGITVIHIVSLL